MLGDLVLVGAMQFAQPSLTSAFDSDPAAAVVQRTRILQLATNEDDWVAGGHLNFPGIGHIRGQDGHYLWLPANYTIHSDGFGFLLVQGMTTFRICHETQLSQPNHPPHLAAFDRRR